MHTKILLVDQHPHRTSTMPGLSITAAAALASSPQPTPASDVSSSKGKELLKKAASSREITPEELKQHSTASEPWFVVNGEVYNGTAFLEDHPGGPDEIIGVAGEDASEAFNAIHPPVSNAGSARSSSLTLSVAAGSDGAAQTLPHRHSRRLLRTSLDSSTPRSIHPLSLLFPEYFRFCRSSIPPRHPLEVGQARVHRPRQSRFPPLQVPT